MSYETDESMLFTPIDLLRIEHIQAQENMTENEEFLCHMIDKFFYRIAHLKDELYSYRELMQQTGGDA